MARIETETVVDLRDYLRSEESAGRFPVPPRLTDALDAVLKEAHAQGYTEIELVSRVPRSAV